MEDKKDMRHENSGRKDHQKMKPFLIYEYLMRETDDEGHYATTKAISAYLEVNFGISAERRSIYRDVDEINKALLAIENDYTLEEAELDIEKNNDLKIIKHHKRKGFYATHGKYNKDDVRLLAECVHTAKFVDEAHADALLKVVYGLVSNHQAESMSHKPLVKDRVKTTNTEVYKNVQMINQAIGKSEKTRRKIKFRYLKYTIQNVRKQVERKQGEMYIVTPYNLLIDSGNYYLLALDEQSQKVRTYRVDRMASVKVLDYDVVNIEGVFDDINIDKYTHSHFGMFSGRRERVTLHCAPYMLDTMIDRFGTENTIYSKSERKDFFNVGVWVYVSKQFFGWVAGFGKQVRILEPQSVREEYENYLKELYEWNISKPKRRS